MIGRFALLRAGRLDDSVGDLRTEKSVELHFCVVEGQGRLWRKMNDEGRGEFECGHILAPTT
jgi:hypothetical protein